MTLSPYSRLYAAVRSVRIASAFGLTVEEVFTNPYPTTSTGPPVEAERRLVRKVLCVCVANSSRSPMMQAVLQQHLGGAYQVESAGLRKEGMGIGANERSILCLKERGIDLTGHRRRYIADLDLSQYCCIVCVGPAEAEQVRAALGAASTTLLVPNAESGGIPDPYEHGLQAYRDCLALLDVVMPEIARQITSA